jgi:NADH-quinone oxidoreductase subunit G
MKIFTRSPRALSAQKATMEFLLINHPLDCPICDQGGECELQDLAMGFGRGVSRYTEGKRVVKDQNLGPLVSTDMTRCIQCTRCVRFGDEIAGIQELGAVGRGEYMEITTYVEKSVDHELSGNIIDLCPVGALNNKPYRFGARAWELIEKPLIAPHDCAGTNLNGHVLRGQLRRIVPRENDAINETWISDRDRFSCFGIYADDRLERPMVKADQEWKEVTWQEAIERAAGSILSAVAGEGDVLGVLAHPSSTVEELHLLRRIADHLGSRNIDHRLRRTDFRDQAQDPEWPALGTSIDGIDRLDGILVVGSNLRLEVPIIAHRIRKAALAGAAVGFVNPVDYPMLFPRAAHVTVDFDAIAAGLAGVVVAAAELTGRDVPPALEAVLDSLKPSDEQRAAAAVLAGKEHGWLVVGQLALRHPRYSEIRALAVALAELTGSRLGYLAEGGNAAGAALVGCLPHRDPGGRPSRAVGYDAPAMLESPRRAYLLLGLEPLQDVADGETAAAALKSADTVVALTSFASDELLECADVLLPIGTFAESEGTLVNGEGRWQHFDAAAQCPGDARPAWRVLRVLANHLQLPDCDYQTAEDLRAEAQRVAGVAIDTALEPSAVMPVTALSVDFGFDLAPCEVDGDALDVPMYWIDPLVRRSEPLQQTRVALERADGPPVAAARTA